MPFRMPTTPGKQARAAAADAAAAGDCTPLVGGAEGKQDGAVGGGRTALYQGRMTTFVLVVAVVASCSGYLFGYDTGIVGGVEAMVSFQKEFFPDIYEESISTTNNDPYCVYNSHTLQLFSASMFLSGALAAVPAGYAARAYGRCIMMFVAGCLFVLGGGLQAGAHNVGMLVTGRLILGCGVGTAACVVPVYISEAAPFANRGGLSILWQLAVTVGILAAQLVNYGTQWIPDWGWRLSLGSAVAPALVLMLAGIILPESPSSLIERGYVQEGRAVLQKLRGTNDVDAEYADICEAAQRAARVSLWQSWRNIFRRQYLPLTITGAALAALQQLTGINAIIFYVPVMFDSLGAGRQSALLNAVIVGGTNVLSTFVGVVLSDRVGRRKLLLQGGIQMVLAQVATAIVLAVGFQGHTTDNLPKSVALVALVLICIFVAGFAWSWGPLMWVISAEVQTLDTRTAGMSATVAVNFLFSFIIGQSFLSMLCAMKWGVFLFFAAWVAGMTIFVLLLLPETGGVPIEDTAYMCLFARHPVWRRVMGPAAEEVMDKERYRVAAWRAAEDKEGGDVRQLARYYQSIGL